MPGYRGNRDYHPNLNGHANSNKARGGSRTAAASKMEHFVIIVNGWKLLTIITKSSILDVAAVLDPPLKTYFVAIKRLKVTPGLET